MVHLNGNLLAAVDVETTGTIPGYHEVVQVAIVPLGPDLAPLPEVNPFYMPIAPEFPERADGGAKEVHGLNLAELQRTALSRQRVADLLDDWFLELDLPIDRRLIPLAHNWAFESAFLSAWLGPAHKERLFRYLARDTMTLALAINDKVAFRGGYVPFNRVSLRHLCKQFGIHNLKPHDALHDCLAEAEVYRHLMSMDFDA